MLGINEEAYFSPSLSAEGGEARLKRFEGGDTGGNPDASGFPPVNVYGYLSGIRKS